MSSSRICPCGLRFVAGFAVHLFDSVLASISRNHSCQLHETREIRYTFQVSRRCWRRALDCRFLARTHSRRALGVWRRGRKSSNSDSFHRSSWDSVRGGLLYHSHLATTESAIHPEAAIQPSQEVANTTSRDQRDMTHRISNPVQAAAACPVQS